MKKKIKIPLIIVGVVIALIIGVAGYKFIDMSNQGVNIFTGEKNSIGQEKIEANSNAIDVELDIDHMFTERDLLQEVTMSEVTIMTLENNKDLTISDEGIYLLNGSYIDTMIIVDVDDQENVQLVFDDLSIVNEKKPVIYIKSADKVFLTTTDSNNEISVTGKYEADGNTNLDAAIFSKSDLVLNGIGLLDITSENGNGISSKDDLKITGGSYQITSLEDGLEANDSIRIYDGDIVINSSNDAIHCVNDEDESLGYVYIEGGAITISAADDAIRGNSAVVINGGTIKIDSCQEGLEASQIIINDGEITLYATDDGINAGYKTSYRTMIEVNGGLVTVAMASGDTDGFDSNGDLTINGGEINVNGGMAAFDIDGVILFNDGVVTVDGEIQSEIVTQQIGFASKFRNN